MWSLHVWVNTCQSLWRRHNHTHIGRLSASSCGWATCVLPGVHFIKNGNFIPKLHPLNSLLDSILAFVNTPKSCGLPATHFLYTFPGTTSMPARLTQELVSSCSVVAYFSLFYITSCVRHCMWPLCISTPPVPTTDASVCAWNGLSRSGTANTGAVLSASFIAQIQWAPPDPLLACVSWP